METVKKVDEQYKEKLVFDIQSREKKFVSIQRKTIGAYMDETKSIEEGKLFQFD